MQIREIYFIFTRARRAAPRSVAAIYYGFILSAFAAVILMGGAAAAGAKAGPFTSQQVQNGASVFSDSCSKCHGSDLEGGAGPALSGKDFESSLEYSKMTARQLFDFISQQMPYDDPGALSKPQYLAVMSFLLSKNGFTAGKKPLTEAALKNVKLVPLPATQNAAK